jgi:serine/threonine protein kinase
MSDGALDPLEAPERIGDRYSVVGPIGDGGSGTVYEATHEELGRRVAIKLLNREGQAVPANASRFAREARVAAEIDHPNVVRVLDFGVDDRLGPYVVMELLVGDRLDDEIVHRGALPLRDTIEWVDPVARALDAIHTMGLIHRDVKPENIMRSRFGEGHVVKLVDFGLAIHADGRDRLTRRGTISGTPHYMAPEVVEGERETVASDVYSLAVVAYELLTGELPHGGASAVDVMKKKISEPPPSLAERTGRMFSLKLEQLFEEGLHTDRAQRPSSAGAFVDRLRACQRRA